MMKYTITLAVGMLLGMLLQTALTGLLGDEAAPHGDVAAVPLLPVDDSAGQPPTPSAHPIPLEQPAAPQRTQTLDAEALPLEPWLMEALRHVPEVPTTHATSSVSGTCVEPDGRPISGMVVTALPYDWPDEFRALFPGDDDEPGTAIQHSVFYQRWRAMAEKTVTTDAAGCFHFDGLADDLEYSIGGEKDGFFGRSERVETNGGAMAGLIIECSPRQSLRLLVLNPDGEPATQAQIRLGRSASLYPGLTDGNPFEHDIWYRPNAELYAYVQRYGWESQHVIVPATDARPVPLFEATLQLTRKPGIHVTLNWDPTRPYLLTSSRCQLVAFTLEETVTDAAISARLLQREQQPESIRDLQEHLEPGAEVFFDDLPPGRYVYAFYDGFRRSPVLRDYVVATLPRGEPQAVHVRLDIPPPPASDYMLVRFTPEPADIAADYYDASIYWHTPDGSIRHRRVIYRRANGEWAIHMGQSVQPPTATHVSVTITFRSGNFAPQEYSFARDEIPRELEVPLVPTVPITFQLTQWPEDLATDAVELYLHRLSGNGILLRPAERGEWRIEGLSVGEHLLYLQVNRLFVTTFPITIRNAEQVIAVPFPRLYTLTITGLPPSADTLSIRRLGKAVLRAGWYEYPIVNGRCVARFLPAGTLNLSTRADDRLQRMVVNLVADDYVAFHPE